MKKETYLETYKIPKKFILLGTKWTVHIEKDVLVNGDKCLGYVNYEKKKIVLKKGWHDVQIVIYHELAHILDYLTDIGREKCNDEIFAKVNSLFWTQAVFQMPLISKEKINKIQLNKRRKKCKKKKK